MACAQGLQRSQAIHARQPKVEEDNGGFALISLPDRVLSAFGGLHVVTEPAEFAGHDVAESHVIVHEQD
jgi:hypothetical protein